MLKLLQIAAIVLVPTILLSTQLSNYPNWTAISNKWFGSKTQLSQTRIPLLSEQPKDLLIAKTVLPIYRWQTKENVPVYFSPTETLPMIDLNIGFKVGAAQAKPGLLNLIRKLLKEDTAKRSSKDLHLAIEKTGMQLSINCSQDRIFLHARLLSDPKYLHPATELLQEILSQSVFNPAQVEKTKNQQLVLIEQNESQAQEQIKVVFNQANYVNHPYQHNIVGDRKSIQELSANELQAFYHEFIVAENAFVTVSGGMHRDLVQNLVKDISAKLMRGKPKLPVNLAERPIPSPMVHQDFNSQQTHIYVGQNTINLQNPDYLALSLGNHILGQAAFTSRLFKEVRGEKGFAYTVRSKINNLMGNGLFLIHLQTKTENAKPAFKLVQSILNKFINDGPSEEELSMAKEHLINAFPLQINSNNSINHALMDMAFWSLPDDYFDTYQEKIAKISVKDISKAWQTHIDPNNLTVASLGKEKLN